MEASNKTLKMHIGKKVGRIREIRGIKQEAIALELGITQQAVSKLEQSEVIEDEILERIAAILGVSAEAIKNFDEEKVIYNIQNNYEGANTGSGSIGIFQYCTFNPLEKLIEALEENKKLYERLLQSEREKIELLKGNK